MKHTVLVLLLAASAVAATAQTPAKPASPATAVHHSAAVSATKLPPGVPPVRGIVRTAFSLRYEDIKIGTGAEAEPNKMYKVFYTGWLGNNGRPDDGHKFDSSYDHPGPVIRDKDGKPELGPDGKPKTDAPQPMSFPQGMGRLIPGFDQGFTGMKIGGKRRIFIPWQLAYGARGRPGPDAAHPGIPPKAELIFDVELVDVTDLPTRPNGPGGMMPGRRPMPQSSVPHPGESGGTSSAPEKAPTAPAPTTTAPATPAPATPTPTTPAQPQTH